MEWVSINDRLPEIPKGKHSITVLVVLFDGVYHELTGKGYSVTTLTFFDGKFNDLACGHNDWEWIPSCDPVTHWMYMPELPESICNQSS